MIALFLNLQNLKLTFNYKTYKNLQYLHKKPSYTITFSILFPIIIFHYVNTVFYKTFLRKDFSHISEFTFFLSSFQFLSLHSQFKLWMNFWLLLSVFRFLKCLLSVISHVAEDAKRHKMTKMFYTSMIGWLKDSVSYIRGRRLLLPLIGNILLRDFALI